MPGYCGTQRRPGRLLPQLLLTAAASPRVLPLSVDGAEFIECDVCEPLISGAMYQKQSGDIGVRHRQTAADRPESRPMLTPPCCAASGAAVSEPALRQEPGLPGHGAGPRARPRLRLLQGGDGLHVHQSSRLHGGARGQPVGRVQLVARGQARHPAVLSAPASMRAATSRHLPARQPAREGRARGQGSGRLGVRPLQQRPAAARVHPDVKGSQHRLRLSQCALTFRQQRT